MKAHLKIAQLREAGLLVKVSHLRVPSTWVRPEGRGELWRDDPRMGDVPMLTVRELREMKMEPSVYGGLTSVAILDAEGQMLAAADAPCSLLDRFSRRLGLTIALGRALKQMPS